jgi:hypothetical protein
VKIPVGRTIERAYGFAFSNFLNIVGIAWFPIVAFVLVLFGLGFAMAPTIGPMLQGVQSNGVDPSKIGGIIGFFVLVVLLGLVLISMIRVGILRQALGKHEGGVFFYFSLGAPVWRMIGALLLAGIVVTLIALGLLAIGAVISAIAGSIPSTAGAVAVRTVTFIGCVCLFIYILVRLVYLLPAVVVAEDTIGLGRAWELSAGNFWRIFVVWLSTYLPLVIVFGILSSLVSGGPMIPDIHQGMTPQQVFQAYLASSRGGGIAGIVLNLVYVIVSAGLTSGAAAKAYLGAAGDKTEAEHF